MKKRKTIIIAAVIIFVSAIVSVCCMNYIEKKNRIEKVEVGDSVSAVIKGDGSLSLPSPLKILLCYFCIKFHIANIRQFGEREGSYGIKPR